MRRPKPLELRKFTGSSLDDCVAYLKRDVSKAFSDLFAILSQKKGTPTIKSVNIGSGGMAASGTNFTLAQLELPKGTWHIVTTVTFDSNSTGYTFSIARAWMTLAPAATGTPGDAELGINYASVNNGLTTDSGGDTDAHTYDEVSLTCQWLLDLSSDRLVTLQGRSIYAGGAGTPAYRCSMVAHGYVME